VNAALEALRHPNRCATQTAAAPKPLRHPKPLRYPNRRGTPKLLRVPN